MLALHFFPLCLCSRWEWGLWDGVGVRYLPASRWLRLLLSRRMGAASIFQLALSGNPLNWIFTGPVFSASVGPQKSTFLLLVQTGQKVFLAHTLPLSVLSSNRTVIDYVIAGREWKVKQLGWELEGGNVTNSQRENMRNNRKMYITQTWHQAPSIYVRGKIKYINHFLNSLLFHAQHTQEDKRTLKQPLKTSYCHLTGCGLSA